MLSLQKLTRVFSTHFLKRMSSSTATATAKATSDSIDVNNDPKKERKSLVAAAFESLKEENVLEDSKQEEVSESTTSKSPQKDESNTISEKLLKAKTVNGLLMVAENNGPITRKDALKIVSILAEWSSMDRVKLSDFESDFRFLKICRMLGRNVTKAEQTKTSGYRTDDLNTVLSIAGDDEAAKLVASISIPQMVKVMTSLAQKRRRSTPLLRSLAYNISSSSDQLDIKQCSDVLYAMASLNFPDSVLTAKICSDLLSVIPKHTEKSAVIGSILTSLGLLKYRDLDVLQSLTSWISNNIDICRLQDINSLFLTLGTLNCKSTDVEALKVELVNSLSEGDFPKKIDLLNHVWALSLIKLADDKHVKSVLSPNFIEELRKEIGNELIPNAKMKLLNINAYAKLILQNFKGPFLTSESDIYSVPLAHGKSKQILLNGMLDALKSLFPSTTCLKSLVDSKMGFLIDAQCLLDSKQNPLPLEKEHKDAIKIAIMVVDFHDTCHGPHRSVTGLTNLCFDLLERSGYKILPVLFSEFSTSDKLLKRVQYLEANLKNIVKLSN